MKIKRKTRIAVHIEERLLVRTRQSGEIAPVSGPPPDGLPGGAASKSEKEKDLPIMQGRITTITLTGALLAISASFAPDATACSLPGFSALRVPVTLPPSLFAPAAQSPAASAGAQAGASIVGLWNVTFYSGGAIVDQAFDAWHSDNTEILNDFTDPIEGNVCLGVWTQTGQQTFKLKHPSWTFDSSGNLTGTAYILEMVTVGPGGNEYAGPYSIDFYDTSGNPVGSFTGVIKANRIMPD